jgi:hypothetical protein
MSHETQNNLRIHYVSAAKNRQRQKFHKTLLLWAWLFALAAIIAGALASAL